MSVTRVITGLAAASALLAGCGEGNEGDDGGGGAGSSPTGEETAEAGGPDLARIEAEFQPYSPDAEAVTYDEEAVPSDATVTVNASHEGSGSFWAVAVSGLEPERAYGAHLHTDPCAEDPEGSGPHYQHDAAPTDASLDPEYANDENEVWLDFTTDGDGTADADAEVQWWPREGEARSIVIHAEHTSTEHDSAGDAGERLGCINVRP